MMAWVEILTSIMASPCVNTEANTVAHHTTISFAHYAYEIIIICNCHMHFVGKHMYCLCCVSLLMGETKTKLSKVTSTCKCPYI